MVSPIIPVQAPVRDMVGGMWSSSQRKPRDVGESVSATTHRKCLLGLSPISSYQETRAPRSRCGWCKLHANGALGIGRKACGAVFSVGEVRSIRATELGGSHGHV